MFHAFPKSQAVDECQNCPDTTLQGRGKQVDIILHTYRWLKNTTIALTPPHRVYLFVIHHAPYIVLTICPIKATTNARAENSNHGCNACCLYIPWVSDLQFHAKFKAIMWRCPSLFVKQKVDHDYDDDDNNINNINNNNNSNNN